MLLFLLAAQIILLRVQTTTAQEVNSIKIGAWGDDASRENSGVGVELRTHIYDSYPGSFDYYWVGNNLADGSFIQFGYGIEPGLICLKGSRSFGKFSCSGTSAFMADDDARWQWQYWPNREGTDFYFEIGPAYSAGANATWHNYTVISSSNRTWNFYFDDKLVSSFNVPATLSVDPAYIVAEQTADQNSSTRLEPVEFMNLSYFGHESWHQVDSLVAVSLCSGSESCSAGGYGIAALGMNHVIAGSGLPSALDGTLLWTSGYVRLTVDSAGGSSFYVNSLGEQREFEDSATVSVPKGMFAYVSLSDTSLPDLGILGLLGGSEHFDSWTGDIQSSNASLRMLMESDISIQGRWTEDIMIPVLFLVILCAVSSAMVLFWLRRRQHVPRVIIRQ